MADYPPTPSYGLNFGEQNNNYMPSFDQQQMDPANHQPAASRVPTNHYPPHQPHLPNAAESFAAYNMANAQFNSNIPIFGGASFPPLPYPPGASFQMASAWNTPAVFPPNNTSWQQPPFTFASNQNQNQPIQSHLAQHLPRLDTNPQQQVNMSEEGELVEELDDNLEGKSSNLGANKNMNGSYSAQNSRADSYRRQYNPSPREAGYRDSPGRAAPPNGPRSGQPFPRRRPGVSSPRNHQSDHYSPYGSPRESYADTRGNRSIGKGGYAHRSPSPEQIPDSYQPSEASHQPTNGLPKPVSTVGNGDNPDLDRSDNEVDENLHEIPDDDRYSPQLERSSTPDKRILAQHAILNLMAAKVQFQDYIQEGVDENLMHGLFESLGMPQTRSKAVQGAITDSKISSDNVSNGHVNQNGKTPTTQSNQHEPSIPPKNALPAKPNANGDAIRSAQPIGNGKKGVESNNSSSVGVKAASADAPAPSEPNGEERKDRIARLLAEKKANQAATADQAAALKTEKQRQLAIKVEALRKSREARTLKNQAANKVPDTPVSAEAKSTEVTPVSPLQPSTQIPQRSPQPPQPSQSHAESASRASPPTRAVSQPQDVQPSLRQQQPSNGGNLPPLVLPMPKETVTPSSVPAIPGLFLSATTAPTSANSNGSSPAPTIAQQRKRPVAADFDEPTPSSSAYKRPFGQSRVEKPLVIDVSDDESSDGDEGSAMDLDQPENSQDSAGPILDIPSKVGPVMRSQPPAPDLEPRQSIAQQNAAVQPAQPVQSYVKPPPDVLKVKLDEIAELHKRIAEAEKKKKAKASANRSGSQTPLTTEVVNAQNKLVNEAIAEKVKATAELERLLEGADGQIASEAQTLADASAKEQEAVAETKKRDVERKRKRRSEIQLSLPAVDAEVEKNQQKLEELRAEMAKAEAAVRKAMEDKQKMENEMAKLGEEAEEQLQTEQAQQLSLTMRETHSSRATPQRVSDPAPEDCAPEARSSVADVSHSLPNGISQEKPAIPKEVISPPQASEDVDMLDNSRPQQQQDQTPEQNLDPQAQGEPEPLTTEDQGPKVIELGSTALISNTEKDKDDVVQNGHSQHITNIPRAQSPMSASADQVLEAALQQASAQAEAESRGASPNTEIANTHAPDPSQLQPYSSPTHDAVEPEVHDTPSPESSARDASNQEEAADDDSDAYEPPEATPPAENDSISLNSPPFSPAPPEVLSESLPKVVPEMSTTNLETVDSIEPLGSINTVQDQETQISAIENEGDDHSGAKPVTFFQPYESPLKQFSSYRFNKNFSDEVSGGFRSISYSHRIDPMKEFCRFELQGGTCNDTNCEFQHFKDLNLADDMILLQLGDSETFNSQPDIKDSFVTGLRGVLQTLKARKTRDFPTIASEIAAFRAKFNAENMVL